ncbi:MAG: prevent-host-death protein [Planctomycetes bacterium]|nr:prevent-host-death protein [Planctomycetota bacterium]
MINDGKASGPATGQRRDVTTFVEKLLDNDEPIVLKINDKMEISVQGDDCRRLLLELIDRSETIEQVQKALESMKRGEGRPLSEVFEENRAKYDLADQV